MSANIGIKTLDERIKPNAWLTPGETGNIMAHSMAEVAELRARVIADKQLIDEQNKLAKERQDWALRTSEVIRELRASLAAIIAPAQASQDERALFEKRFGPNDNFAWRDQDDKYKSAALQHAWDIWQASVATPRVQIAAQSAPQQACKWTPTNDDSGAWDSACGETYLFGDGAPPAAHGVKFCHGCGNIVSVADPAADKAAS